MYGADRTPSSHCGSTASSPHTCIRSLANRPNDTVRRIRGRQTVCRFLTCLIYWSDLRQVGKNTLVRDKHIYRRLWGRFYGTRSNMDREAEVPQICSPVVLSEDKNKFIAGHEHTKGQHKSKLIVVKALCQYLHTGRRRGRFQFLYRYSDLRICQICLLPCQRTI